MWFAYADRSMAWYDLDVQDVKKLIAQNKKGEKTPPLEEIKTNDAPVKSVDLIQENNMDRFERKNRNSGKNQNRKKPNNGPKPNNTNQPKPKTENKVAAKPNEKRPNAVANQPQNAKSPNQQPKKFKKKFAPKRDDKA